MARPVADRPGPRPPGPRDVVVGEAVALELRLAKLPSRAIALAVDLGLLAVPLFVAALLAAAIAGTVDDALGTALFLVTLVGVVLGYPIMFETLARGRSPGKAALGLRVVRDDGGPTRFRHALVRALLGVFVDFNPFLVGFVGLVVSLCSSKGKRVGDLLAGTVVVRERVPVRAGAPPPVSPQMARWAAGLQVSLLPDDLALAVRSLLARRTELDPMVAAGMARRLATEVAGAIGTEAAPGLDPFTFLGAVLAERRARELARTAPHAPSLYGPRPHGPAQQPHGPAQQPHGPAQQPHGPSPQRAPTAPVRTGDTDRPAEGPPGPFAAPG